MLVVHGAIQFKKYCKTDIWLSYRHTEGSALSSATSPSRRGSALRSTWRGVLIFWQLDLQVSRAGLWGKSSYCWIGSVWGDKTQERERRFTPVMSVTKLSSLCKCLVSTQLGSTVAMCLFACKGCGKKFNPTTAWTIYCVGF